MSPHYLLEHDSDTNTLKGQFVKIEGVEIPGNVIVGAIHSQAEALRDDISDYQKGNVLKFTGPISVAGIAAIVDTLKDVTPAIAVFDPKLGEPGLEGSGKFIICSTTSPRYKIGDILEEEEDDDGEDSENEMLM